MGLIKVVISSGWSSVFTWNFSALILLDFAWFLFLVGRKFYSCDKQRNETSCNFFMWATDVESPEERNFEWVNSLDDLSAAALNVEITNFASISCFDRSSSDGTHRGFPASRRGKFGPRTSSTSQKRKCGLCREIGEYWTARCWRWPVISLQGWVETFRACLLSSGRKLWWCIRCRL